jgi:hypothetical protein
MSYLRYLCLLAYSGVHHILCYVYWCACLRIVSCAWRCPTSIVLCLLVCLSSYCVLCMAVSNIYCVVFIGVLVFVLCLVHGGVHHILCYVYWCACLRIVSCAWRCPTSIVLCVLLYLSSILCTQFFQFLWIVHLSNVYVELSVSYLIKSDKK